MQIDDRQVLYVSTREVFQDSWFEIPDYQRGYAWGERQIQDLIDDLSRCIRSGQPHFTGTIVASPKGSGVFDVIDGQQRLTTTTLLLKAITETDAKFKPIFDEYIQRGDVGKERLVLKPNQEIAAFYKHRIIMNDDRHPTVASHRALLSANRQFKDWLARHEFPPDDALEALLDRFFFVVFFPPSENEVGLMFEVINNRGKGLSQLEKIKNYLIYFATIHSLSSLREDVNEAWGLILQRLSIAHWASAEDEDRFLRNCYLVFFDPNKSKSWSSYEQLKDQFPVDVEDINGAASELADFVRFLVSSAEAIAKLSSREYAANNGVPSEYADILSHLRCHGTDASVLPLYLATMNANTVAAADRFGIIDLLERLNFRVYLLPKVTNRADSGQGELFRWAYEYYHNEINTQELREKITEFVSRHCDLINFVDHLTIDQDEQEDYYEWSGVRYLLARYEQHIQDERIKASFDIERVLERRRDTKTGDYLSVEHIWARKNREKDFPDDPVQKRRLGNLVLLELRPNIRLQDRDIEEKTEEIQKRNSNTVTKLAQVFELSDYLAKALNHPVVKGYVRHTKNWHRDLATAIADARETDIIRFVLEAWSLPDEDTTRFECVDSFRDRTKNSPYWLRHGATDDE